MESNTPDTPRELLALNAESGNLEDIVKVLDAQNTIENLRMNPIEELDLLLSMVRRQRDFHHFVMTEMLEDPEPESQAVAIWSADLQRLE